MSNKFILDLTVRLTQALDQNYDVVNMDTVLAVISALEGATITKEQLETTRLAKHINQLRRRNKNNILAIRAKNLLKKWREMFGITSQAQSECTTSVTLQAQPTQQPASKPAKASTSQPASPYITQLLGDNFDNSLSSIGGGNEFSRAATGGVGNTGSANFTYNKISSIGTATTEGNGTVNSRSNGALTDTQTRSIKSLNRGVINNNSPSLPGSVSAAAAAANTTTTTTAVSGTKVKHPTSFKNLITGFKATSGNTKQTNPSTLSPLLKQPTSAVGGGGGGDREQVKTTNLTTYIIDDDDNQSQPSKSGVVQTGVASPHTYKSTKRKERDSPSRMAFNNIDHSNSPLGFENASSREAGRSSKTARHNNVTSTTIDLHDTNSFSNCVNSLGEVTEISTPANSSGRVGNSNNSSKRIRKEKKQRSTEKMVDLVTESEHFQPTIDESSRIAFPISGIQEYLSLSNSSMSIFPSQQTAGSGVTERYANNTAGSSNIENQLHLTERNSEVLDGDLTFAGKFKQNNSSGGLEVGFSSNYFSNGVGGETTSLKSGEFSCGNMKVAINNCRDSLNVSGGPPSTTTNFLPFIRNSNDSTINSRTSQLDLIDVVNQDSQSMITVDDLRQQQQQSSNEKIKTQKDVEPPVQVKFPKDGNDTSKQYSKGQTKSATGTQRPINASSKPSTPTTAPITSASVTSPPPVEQNVPKKRGRKKGSKGVDSVLAQSACLSSQFLMGPALGQSKKVKTTMELLADIQNRKLGSATSSPTLTNWLGTSRPPSSCSEHSLDSPRTSDACSTNATSIAARSTPEKNISNNSVAPDDLYESDSETNTSEPSHDSVKMTALKNSQSKALANEAIAGGATAPSSTIEEEIKQLIGLLPPVDPDKIDWEAYEDVPCTCTLREIAPEIDVAPDQLEADNKPALDLLESVDDIKNKTNDGDEPVISVSILPSAIEQPPAQEKLWSPIAVPHSQSAPVSAIISPKVPSTNQKLKKSIFDLDFDDDDDPLHSFVEAGSKIKMESSAATTENGRIKKDEQLIKSPSKNEQHTDIVKSEPIKSQSEPEALQTAISQPTPKPQQIESNDPMMNAPVMNFPTYEVVEDAECEAKLRYELQTNQITKFHINAFHNYFIPNVNGNWDHSVPPNVDEESELRGDDDLYENVVPMYGCFATERIPKDLSQVKFTKNFTPKTTKKSDKPPAPFLGVANIHRRQRFRLHHKKRHAKNKAVATQKKKRKQSKLVPIKTETDAGIKKQNIKLELDTVPDPSSPKHEATATASNIPEKIIPATEAMEVDSSPNETANNNKTEPESELERFPTNVPEVSLNDTKKTLDNPQQCKAMDCTKLDALLLAFDKKSEIDGGVELPNPNTDITNPAEHPTVSKKLPIANGHLHHLTNNNSIIHCSDDNKREIIPDGCTKVLHNNNHNIVIDVDINEEGIAAASRRSSSCSNSSLKQNQNSINMKLRRHRLEQQELEKQKQLRKRKFSHFTDVFDFDADADAAEHTEQTKVPQLIKRIKIVNGEYASARQLTNSITDDDGDSDCYHAHSETDIITEEEIDDDGDADDHAEDDYEDVADDYDEEDGDDEEDTEENYGDFHEVVTRDMASTTGNNHIVLTIKKTPSKTNSPSSSSMSPALNVNTKVPSMSPTIQSTVDALLLEDNAIELNADSIESTYQAKLSKFLDMNVVKATDLIDKAEFFLPDVSNVAVYNFHLKRNGDNDAGDDNSNGEVPNFINANEEDVENGQPENEAAPPPPPLSPPPPPPSPPPPPPPTGNTTENTENENSENANTTADQPAVDTAPVPNEPEIQPIVKSKEFKKITKTVLSESIELTKTQIRRQELKDRLKQGIEEAQKLHRQLFFPHELYPTVGQKLLEISSCTSDCTDPSDDDTDDDDDDSSDNSDTSDSSSSSSDDDNGQLKSRRKLKLRPKRSRAAAGGGSGGGNPPSSSSSSSSSDSSSSSSSAFTSLTTTTSSSSDDEDNKKSKKRKPPPPPPKVKTEEEPSSSTAVKPKEDDDELPSYNNLLLRSFNHIYVSTEERRRQEQLKRAATFSHDIMNSGYISLTADDSKEDDDNLPAGGATTSRAAGATVAARDNCDVYINYFNNNQSRNIYSKSNNNNGITSSNNTTTTPANNMVTSIIAPSIVQTSHISTTEPAVDEPSNVIGDTLTVVNSSTEATAIINESSSSRINTDISIGSSSSSNNINNNNNRNINNNNNNDNNNNTNNNESNNNNDNNNDTDNINNNNINNNFNNNINSRIQLGESSEQELVAHDEYRTGMRKVDEDVDDEDGNNCARTQQFKEWHEVLQLRSYNDELLTVLPYVVIE